MPRTCTICRHRDREPIERALLAREPYRHIAKQFDTSTAALQRHKQDHIPLSIARAHDSQQAKREVTLLEDVRSRQDRIEKLHYDLEMIRDQALASKDFKTATNAVNAAVNVMREERSYLELQGKITGELDPPAPARGPFSQVNNNLGLVVFPKTPEVDRQEREWLSQMRPEERYAMIQEQIASGINVLSPAKYDVLHGRFDQSLEPLDVAPVSVPAAPVQRALPPGVPRTSERPAADEPVDQVDRPVRIKPISIFDPLPSTNS